MRSQRRLAESANVLEVLELWHYHGVLMTYAIKLVNKSGSEVYLCEGLRKTPAHFPSRAAAERQKQFMSELFT